jgi:hypothetical protein
LQVKTEETIYELFLWQQGDFRFLENILPAKKFQPLNLPVEMIVLEGVRRQDEWARCAEYVPDETYIPKVVKAVDVEQLGEIELNILREINDKNSIELIALANRLASFHVVMFVFQGMTHGLFEVRAPGDEITAIPGFPRGSWLTMIHQVEEMMAEGDLLAALRRLGEIREKYTSEPDVTKHADAVLKKLEVAAQELKLTSSAVLELAIPTTELTSLTCSPQEGFLLSRINGAYSLGEILKMIPGSELENRLLVNHLMQRGVVRHGEQ